jgi:hypothetical protein
VPVDDRYYFQPNTPREAGGGSGPMVPAPGVLANDYDAEGDRLRAYVSPVGMPAHGTLTLNQDGSFFYSPNPGYRGLDSFTYYVDDGTANSSGFATVWLQVGPGRLNLPAVMR